MRVSNYINQTLPWTRSPKIFEGSTQVTVGVPTTDIHPTGQTIDYRVTILKLQRKSFVTTR